VGEGAIVKDCRGIGRMGVMYKVDIIDYLCVVSVGVKEGRREEGKEKREKMKRDKKDWERERKIVQESAKQIEIRTEWKRKIDNKLKTKEFLKVKIYKYIHIIYIINIYIVYISSSLWRTVDFF
jgi:hypothetical protein